MKYSMDYANRRLSETTDGEGSGQQQHATSTRRSFGSAGMLRFAVLSICALLLGASFSSAQAQNIRAPRIVGGSLADSNEFPWMAALVNSSYNDAYFGQFCGAALIGPRWVVTAAHCVTSIYDPSYVENPANVDVVIGRSDLRSDEGERISARRIIVHNRYATTGYPDIALIELQTESTIQPVWLAKPSTVDSVETPGSAATAIGWGDTSENGFSTQYLRKVTVPITTDQYCKNAYDGDIVSGAMICAGLEEGGRDACQGDSGGPLIVFDEQRQRYRQVGVTSFGEGCARPNLPGVYARLSSYWGWIREVTGIEEDPVEPNPDLRSFFTYNCAELTCRFDGSRSDPGASEIVRYFWAFDKNRSRGGVRRGTRYSKPGYYIVGLEVTDAFGNTRKSRRRVLVPMTSPGLTRKVYRTEGSAEQKVVILNSEGTWANEGTLTGRLVMVEDADLKLHLQRQDPFTQRWTTVNRSVLMPSGRAQIIQHEAEPGNYRWFVSIKNGEGKIAVVTDTP